MSAELKPCPMCGCAATYVKHSAGMPGTQGFDKWDAVACKHCRTTVGACDRRFRNRDDAAEAWNRRTPIAPGAAEGWNPMDDAPFSGLILLRVAAGDEIRVFVAERSISQYDDCWMVTHGWTGWGRMNSSWKPTGWKPIFSKVEKEGGSDER